MHVFGTVAELWRYPVKSMRGEQLHTAAFDEAGMVGDRRFAVASTAAPSGKPLVSSRERTALLLYKPRLDPTPEVLTPQGTLLPLPSPELLDHLQQHVAVPGAALALVHTPQTPQTDVRPLSLVSTATLRLLRERLGDAFSPQRLRNNLVLDLADPAPFAEEALAGQRLRLGRTPGAPLLHIRERVPRCRMVSLDPETAENNGALLRYLALHRGNRIAMYATLLQPGTISVGSPVISLHQTERDAHCV